MKQFTFPQFSARAFAVWQRNFLVWKKLAIPSLLGNLADPMIYLFGLGYGLGSLLPQVAGVPYIAFLASGTVCAASMNAASFEALYSAYSRMAIQRTWEAILHAPMSLDDVVAGEWLWAASKATLSGSAILLVVSLAGFVTSPLAWWTLPVIFLTGLTFSALGLVISAVASGYEFFMYYFTLVLTPMVLLCGVFFPVAQLPVLAQAISAWLPLTHAVALVRPLLFGHMPNDIVLHVSALLTIALAAFWMALRLTERRLLK
jgi:lipooligosaccharide transport system permease protein